MACFDFKSFLETIKKMLPPKGSSNEALINELFFSLTQTQLYQQQNSDNTREWTSQSSTSKIVNHERSFPQDIIACARSIDQNSADFSKVKNSLSNKLLKRIGSKQNKDTLIKEMISKIELDDTISETNKEKFREAAEQNYAIFLTKVLLYLFSNDPQPAKEKLNNDQKNNLDKAHKRFNIFATIHNSKEKKYDRLYPDEINLNSYNLFVIRKMEFKDGIALTKSVLDKRFTDPDIKEKTDTSENHKKDILQNHPSLFIPYDQNTDASAQSAYIGFIDKYIEEFDNLIIYWHCIAELPARYIRAWRDRLGLIDIDYDITELDVPHWAVKNSDLFHAIKGILPNPLLKIPETSALLRTIHLKYNGFNKGVSLEFIYYYYGDNGPYHTTMTKTLQIPIFSNNRTLKMKKTNFIFDKCNIATDLEFTNTLPHISLLTDLLPEIEDKHIPMIKATPVILGNHLNWYCCKLIEEGDHLVVTPSSAQNEADDIDQSIGELIDAILYWANKKGIINKQEAIEQFIYLTY